MKRRQAGLANYGGEIIGCRYALPWKSRNIEISASFDASMVDFLTDFEHLKNQSVIQFLDRDKNRQKVKLVHKNRVSFALPNAPNNNYKNR
jgi:hypothetical protein